MLGPLAAMAQAMTQAYTAHVNEVEAEPVVTAGEWGVRYRVCPCGASMNPKSFKRHLREVHGAKKRARKWKRAGELKARR